MLQIYEFVVPRSSAKTPVHKILHCINMTGMCGCRKYEWVVKGGEETRIDQRIEQLFDIMNGLMQRQPGAAAHSLQVTAPGLIKTPGSRL